MLGTEFLSGYPEGGGHWTWFLQYPLGLRALGHDVFVLEVVRSTGERSSDERLVGQFFRRLGQYGLRERAAILVHAAGDDDPPALESGVVYGADEARVLEIARSADLLWNLCGSLGPPLRRLFRRRVLIDTDPGIYQLSALEWDMGIDDHQVLLTVGAKINDADCEVPRLGRCWHPFRPFVHLPLWPTSELPGGLPVLTSVTTWKWVGEAFSWQGRKLNTSKRDAYLRYVDLPRQQVGARFKLAANIHPLDRTGDREMLLDHGWALVHPERVARTPRLYRRFIERSFAELCCCKPIYTDLRTGWFSDRSACYLAAGRPVLCEDTGFSDHLPTEEGLLAFANEQEAADAVRELTAAPRRHARAARTLAEEFFAAQRNLQEMLDCC